MLKPIILIAIILLSSSTIYYSYPIMQAYKIVETIGTIRYPPTPNVTLTSYLEAFHSGRGILSVRDGECDRSNILYPRMQLSAEINNSATEPKYILVPSGGWYTASSVMNVFGDAWSEGGIDFTNLKRNLAYCWNNGYIPVLALWITNIDPETERTVPVGSTLSPEAAALRAVNPNAFRESSLPVYAFKNLGEYGLPKLMANETGYTKFFTWLKEWMYANGYSDKIIIWEPCWEFNLDPWTNWGGAGVGRYWCVKPISYYNAMKMIMNAKASVGFSNILVASHIIPWSADEWVKRGRLRIDGSTGSSNNKWYLEGIKLVDVWGTSLYGEWSGSYSVEALGVHGYVDWLFEKIIKQMAQDPDIGAKFIGTFEYNMPWQLYELRTDKLLGYTVEQIDAMAVDYIEYTYSKVPVYFNYIKYLGWWVPFESDNQWNAWKKMTAQYDGWKPLT